MTAAAAASKRPRTRRAFRSAHVSIPSTDAVAIVRTAISPRLATNSR